MTSFDLRNSPIVLLDDSRAAHKAGASLLFHSPDHIIKADSFEEVAGALTAIDEVHAKGFHTAGWISYEVAAAFEPRLASRLQKKADEPLIWMMVTKHRESLTPAMVQELFHNAARGNRRPHSIDLSSASHSRDGYLKAFDTIQDFIQAGDVYQINHTFPSVVEIKGDALALYEKLRASQPVAYGAYIDTGSGRFGPDPEGTKILSLSPELFLRRSGDRLSAKPMKGTAPRGKNSTQDQSICGALLADEKSRAENLMIVDLIRNDLSRVAAKASVKTERLFEAEKYPTLFQMTSTVSAEAKPGLKPSQMLKAMFPCGSVTGAPKVRAMEIISELEDAPRGVYCGAIGHFSPAAKNTAESWTLNVPIRTLCLPGQGKGRLSVGSGIVADSDGEAEYQECLLKARFLTAPLPDFALIETFRYEKGNFLHLVQHLSRLRASADYFDFDFNQAEIDRVLKEHCECTEQNARLRTRLLMTKEGHCSVTSSSLDGAEYCDGQQLATVLALPLAGTVKLSQHQVDADNLFLQHKTTMRTVFDNEHSCARAEGHLDVLFANNQGHVTEGAISNVFVVENKRIITPPIDDGLLPGILRSVMIEPLPATKVEVRSITVEDLENADMLLIGNSARGLRRVKLV